MKKIILLSALLSIQHFVYAVDDDIQLRLNQDIQQQQLLHEQNITQLRKQDSREIPSIVINGEVTNVQENIEDVGLALYLAVMKNQWQVAALYLDAYLKIEGHDQSLVLFAEGVLARVQGNLKHAEQNFKQILIFQPGNQIVKLELARVLTEQQKNKEAKKLFQQVKDDLASSTNDTAQNIIKNVDAYLTGLDQRDAWQGSIAFGSRYNTNLNNSSEYYDVVTLYLADNKGNYILDKNGNRIPYSRVAQETPDPINTTGFDYEATLTKRWSLYENHGITFRGLGYGQVYPNESNYNELIFNFNAGYSYQNQHNQILIAPVFEHKYYAREALYNAWGGRAEWMGFIGQDKALKLETEIKNFNYSNYPMQNGVEYAAFATFWKVLPKKWILFGGLDYVNHNTKEKYYAAYTQEGTRLGVSKQFNAGFNANFSTSYRWRQFDKYTTLYGTRRHDFEQNYNLTITAVRWQFYDLVPKLTYQYNHNNSNVEKYYSYDKHNISLKLEHRF